MSAVLKGQVFAIRSHEVANFWPLVAPHVERFCAETDESTANAVLDDLVMARKQLWGYHDGARITGVGITEIAGRVCWLWGGAGTESWYGQIESVIEEIEAWAASLGCTKLRIRGRVGWERRLKGFKRTAIILERPIHGNRNQS